MKTRNIIIALCGALAVTAIALPPIAADVTIVHRLLVFTILGFVWSVLAWRAANISFPVSGPRLSFAQLGFLVLPGILFLILYLAAYWPGIMSNDSFNEWAATKTGKLPETYSIGHTLLTYLFVRAGLTPTDLIIFQALALITSIVFCLRELHRWGVHPLVLQLISIVIFAAPATGMLMVTMWKDVPYAAACTIAFGVSLAAIRKNGHLGRGRLVLLSLALLGIISLRLNGVLVAVGLPFVLAVFYSGNLRRLYASLCAGALAGFVLITMLLAPTIGMLPIPPQYKSIVPMHVVGAMVAADVPLSEPDRASLEKIMPLSQWGKLYHCQNSGALFWSAFQSPGLKSEVGPLIRMAIEQSILHPRVLLRHELCVTSLLWQIGQWNGAWLTIVPNRNIHTGVEIPDELKTAPLWTGANNFSNILRDWTTGRVPMSLIWRPAAYLYGSIFLAIFLCLASGRRDFLLLAAIPILNTLSLALLIGSQDFRYQYPVMLAFLLSVPLVFSRGARNGNVQTTTPQ